MDLQEMRELTPFALAAMADCASPDTIAEHGEPGDSAGAAFLRSVRDDLVDRLEWARESGRPAGAPWPEIVQVLEADGSLHEIADGAPDVYTHARWAEFVDLAAYQEDPSELLSDPGDMTATAGVCLYLIAERLVRALVDELPEDEEEPEDAPVPPSR